MLWLPARVWGLSSVVKVAAVVLVCLPVLLHHLILGPLGYVPKKAYLGLSNGIILTGFQKLQNF